MHLGVNDQKTKAPDIGSYFVSAASKKLQSSRAGDIDAVCSCTLSTALSSLQKPPARGLCASRVRVN